VLELVHGRIRPYCPPGSGRGSSARGCVPLLAMETTPEVAGHQLPPGRFVLGLERGQAAEPPPQSGAVSQRHPRVPPHLLDEGLQQACRRRMARNCSGLQGPASTCSKMHQATAWTPGAAACGAGPRPPAGTPAVAATPSRRRAAVARPPATPRLASGGVFPILLQEMSHVRVLAASAAGAAAFSAALRQRPSTTCSNRNRRGARLERRPSSPAGRNRKTASPCENAAGKVRSAARSHSSRRVKQGDVAHLHEIGADCTGFVFSILASSRC